MDILNNKTIRVDGTDIVSTEIFNQVFSSLDRTIFTVQNIQVVGQNQTLGTFTSSLTNNINVLISVVTNQSSQVDIKINYSNQLGSQQYDLLSSYTLSGSETYTFNPAFISTSIGTPVSIVISSTASISVSASAIVA